MVWAIVWSVLAVGTLVGAFFLGRWLWRRGTALAHALGDASQAAGRLGERADELAAAARDRNPVPPVALARDTEELRDDLAAVRARRRRRRDRRRAGYPLVWERWRDLWR